MIYIQDYNTTDFTEYSEQLKKEFNMLDIQKLTWIKTKHLTSTPFWLPSKKKNLPDSQAYLESKQKQKCRNTAKDRWAVKNYLNTDTHWMYVIKQWRLVENATT